MQYFRNYELANMFSVSQAAVGKWISSAKSGKLELSLVESEGKSYIANTAKNLASIEAMVKERKKYFNKRSLKVVTPSAEFYKMYNKAQILDIISNIDIHGEIPLQYAYFDGGAEYWDKYSQRLAEEETSNLLKATIELLGISQDYLDNLTHAYERVNVIDLGVGNGYPVKELLAHLLAKKKLGRYIGIDLSEKMLDITEGNIKEWFGDNVTFERYERDITYDRFVDIAPESLGQGAKSTNLVLLLGGTLNNFRSPSDIVKVLSSSLSKNDFFIYSARIDSNNARLHFDFKIDEDSPALPQALKLIPDLLNIKPAYYTIESRFDSTYKARNISIRLNVALTLRFTIDDMEKEVELLKGDTILLWRAMHLTAMQTFERFDENGLELLHASETPDRNYIVTMTKIKTQSLH